MILVLKLADLGSILLVLLSVYPGVLNDFGVMAILSFLIVIGGWIVLLIKDRAAEKAVESGLLADGEIGGRKSLVPTGARSSSRWRS